MGQTESSPESSSSSSSSRGVTSAEKLYIGCNWKCSIESPEDADKLVESLNDAWKELPTWIRNKMELSVHPPYVFVDRVRQHLHQDIAVGSQNVYDSAFPNKGNTGATTPSMLSKLGISWVLLGHSDRRNNLGETDELLAAKAKEVLELPSNMNLCLTIGELKEQRENGETLAVLEQQLSTVAKVVPDDAWNRVALAYEPVWAVGEGATPCAPEEAQRIHSALRTWISTNVSPEAAAACRITYTGSVNEHNAAGYAALSEVDGFVVGRAGLDAAKLTSIMTTLVETKQKVAAGEA